MRWLMGASAAKERICCGPGLLHSSVRSLRLPVPQGGLIGLYACVESHVGPVSVDFIYAITGVPVLVLCPNSTRATL